MGTTQQTPRMEQMAMNLRVLRAKVGWGLVEAAQKIGIAELTLIKLERGERGRVRSKTLQKLAEAYNVTVADLTAPEHPEQPGQPEEPVSDEADQIARRVVQLLQDKTGGAAPGPLGEAHTGSVALGSVGATGAIPTYEEFLAMLAGMEKAYAPDRSLDWSEEEIVSAAMEVMKRAVEHASHFSTPPELATPMIVQAAEVSHLLVQRLPEGTMEEVARRLGEASDN